MTEAQRAAASAFERSHPLSVWSASEDQIDAWSSDRQSAIDAAASSEPGSPAGRDRAARGSTPAEARSALLWDQAFCRVNGVPTSSSPATNAPAAKLWADAWSRVDAEPTPTIGATPAPDPGSDVWARAFDAAGRAK